MTSTGLDQIPLARPILGPEEEERVLAVLRSGQLSLGPLLDQFERAFAARLGAAHGVAVSSGTAGLHLALRAVGVSDGDEVITSALLLRGLGQRRAVRAGPPGVRRHRSR